MPKETTNHKLRYPEKGDPDTLAAYWQHLAEDTERELDAIKPKQIVPGSKGQLLMVDNTGATAFKAMKGDGTLAEDGTLTIGKEKVTSEKLGPKAVKGANVDEKVIALSHLASALGLTDSYIAAENKDGEAETPSLRTLGTGAKQAAAGNDPRIGSLKKKIISEGESITSSTFASMPTPDEIPSIFVSKDGLLLLHYSAMWFSSVENAGRAAIFIGSNQLKVYQPGTGGWKTQAACWTGGESHRRLLTTAPLGLVSASESKVVAGEEAPTTGVALTGGIATAGTAWREELGGSLIEHTTDFPQGGLLIVDGLPEGEYSVSVRFKSASGSVSAINRRLRAWTREPQ